MHAQPSVQDVAQIHIARHTDQASDEANQGCSPWLNDQISRRANRYSSSQRRILNVYHVELALWTQQLRKRKRAHSAKGQADDRVDDNSMLSCSSGKCSIEGWPKQKQKQSTNHGKEIRGASAGVEDVVTVGDTLGRDVAKELGDTQTKVSPKHMDKDRAAHVHSFKFKDTNALAEGEEDELKDDHDEELRRASFAKDSAKRDKHSSSREVGRDKISNVKIYMIACSLFLKNPMPKRCRKQRPLKSDRREEHVVANRTKAIAVQERHQKAKPNVNHHMHILVEGVEMIEFNRGCRARLRGHIHDTALGLAIAEGKSCTSLGSERARTKLVRIASEDAKQDKQNSLRKQQEMTKQALHASSLSR
eukprot:m.84374 g.84374  ORF g.84374 m.84374 type:complete len:363 (+) comp14682_c0_seq21:414-1502(+)